MWTQLYQSVFLLWTTISVAKGQGTGIVILYVGINHDHNVCA